MKSKVLSLSKVIFKNSFQNMETAKEVNNKKSKSMIILYIFAFLYKIKINDNFIYICISIFSWNSRCI